MEATLRHVCDMQEELLCVLSHHKSGAANARALFVATVTAQNFISPTNSRFGERRIRKTRSAKDKKAAANREEEAKEEEEKEGEGRGETVCAFVASKLAKGFSEKVALCNRKAFGARCGVKGILEKSQQGGEKLSTVTRIGNVASQGWDRSLEHARAPSKRGGYQADDGKE